MSENKYIKYPRTFHLPWSEGVCSDDKIIPDSDCFKGKEVVVTEKMDGENTSMYYDHYHARSLDGQYHESRSWTMNLWGKIRHNISEHGRVCGENMFWVHSIVYTDLPSYFLMFSYWEDETCFSWDDTVEIADRLGLEKVPVLYRGIYDETVIKELYNESMYNQREGYVVRTAESFQLPDFKQNVAKFVRPNHVQTDQHWLRSGGELNMVRVKK